MNPLELAFRYMELFYGGNVEELREILAEGLRFEGPFFTGDSAEAYLDALRKDPPQAMDYEVLVSFEKAPSACLIYRLNKPGLRTPMAQLFDVEDDKISRILLIFDTTAFGQAR